MTGDGETVRDEGSVGVKRGPELLGRGIGEGPFVRRGITEKLEE